MVNIIVVFPKLEDAKNIRNLLARNGYSVIGVCCTGAQVLQIIDNLEDGIVICGYRFNDMMYADLRESLASQAETEVTAEGTFRSREKSDSGCEKVTDGAKPYVRRRSTSLYAEM